MIERGVKVKTRRPDMTGLNAVMLAFNSLHGERHAPELPIPQSAIRGWALRYGFSHGFCRIVTALDNAILLEGQKEMDGQQRDITAAQKKIGAATNRARGARRG